MVAHRPGRRAFLGGCGALTMAASALAAAARPASAAAPHAPDTRGERQLRGVWIATVGNIDWPSAPGLPAEDAQGEFTVLLDRLAALGVNAVFVQVRPTADAFWPSRLEPWSQWLTGAQGRDPGWDPLAFVVDAAHRRGLAFHAWFNPYRVTVAGDASTLVADHPARRHPAWTVGYGDALYYNPGVPAVRAFVERAVLDAVTRYPIDGVHFDDYFYPYPAGGRDFPDDAAFAAHGAGFADRAAWRRHNVDLLIRETRDLVRAARPDAAFGVSPFGVWRNAATDPAGSATASFQSYDGIHADSLGWLRAGLLDYVAPQLYWHLGHPLADYRVLARWWADRTSGTDTQLWIGQAAYRAGAAGQDPAWSDPAELSRHLAFGAGLPAIGGDLLFSAKDVVADRLGSISRLAAEHWQRPALLPLLPRLAGGAPPRRPALRIDPTGRLHAEPADHAFVFALRHHARPGAPGTLVAVLPTAAPRYRPGTAGGYTVTALDRAGRESAPSEAVTV